jgi:hypothetical protein
MRTRQLVLCCGLLCLAAGAFLALASQGSFAEPLPPQPEPAATPVAVPEDGGDVITPASGAADGGSTAAAEPAVAAAAKPHARVDTSGWQSGIIRGDIQLAVAVLEKLTTITIIVEEARRADPRQPGFKRPHRLLRDVKRAIGTPTFEVPDVPFSEYPYIVTAYAPGLNASRRTVNITAEQPLVDDVVLTLTLGAPFTVLVRDQDSNFVTGVDVRMEPVGEPGGRTMQGGTTNAFGSVAFESMLAGDYQVSLLKNGQYLLPQPTTVTVHPGTAGYGAKALGQSCTLVLARGVPLRIGVFDTVGYGIAEATVTATPTDRIVGKPILLTTDNGGFADFAHLLPGTWQITVEKEGFQRTDQQVALREGQAQETREVRLVHLR